MEQGTAKTLRVLGIIATTLFTLAACGILLLLGVCAGANFGGSSQGGKGVPYFLGALAVLGVGIWIIVALARAMMRSHREEIAAYRERQGLPSSSALPGPPAPDLPLHITPEGQKASDLVIFAICASFLFTIISWFLNQAAYGTSQRNILPRGWLLYFVVVFVLYNLPYAVLLISFLTRPGRHTFYFAVAVPGVQTLFTLFTVATLTSFYLRVPRALLMAFIGWLIDIAILVLAWRAMQKNRVRADPAGLVLATLAAFVYFLLVRGVAPLLYHFIGR